MQVLYLSVLYLIWGYVEIETLHETRIDKTRCAVFGQENVLFLDFKTEQYARWFYFRNMDIEILAGDRLE